MTSKDNTTSDTIVLCTSNVDALDINAIDDLKGSPTSGTGSIPVMKHLNNTTTISLAAFTIVGICKVGIFLGLRHCG